MKIKDKLVALCKAANDKFHSQFGFYMTDTRFSKIMDYMHIPKDSSSLAVTRFFFGLAMLFDIADERGGVTMEQRWGDPNICHFPLLPFLQPMPMPYMVVVYGALWVGALGIMLGYRYRINVIMFCVSYWYLFLIEKSFWNNHSYLFGLVALLLACTKANCYWSIDALRDPSIKKTTVPYWNYFIIKYQFFILYFMAGMKKGTAEWLTGYSMQNLSDHWVFTPFRLFLTGPQTDDLVVHWFVFAFDLTVAFWMMYSKTRHVAMVFCALFHLMNSRLFTIGMFPWVCLATMPLFYPFDWPKVLLRKLKFTIKECDNITDSDCSEKRRRLTLYLILFHVVTQAFLPYSHFITKGYNNWTNGLYGYSWDMMVHTWDTHIVVVKLVDNANNSEYYIDPYLHTPNERWARHGDMVYQYAKCVKEIIQREAKRCGSAGQQVSDDLSIYVEVWCSLNGRVVQRLFDSNVDILKVDWSPFRSVSYLMPLLDESLSWRNKIYGIRKHIQTLSNFSHAVFLADFPGYSQEQFISANVNHVTLTILQGLVVYEPQVTDIPTGHSYRLSTGDAIEVDKGMFHKVLNIGETPTYYMYTFFNSTQQNSSTDLTIRPMLPIATELYNRFNKIVLFGNLLVTNIFELLYSGLSTCH